MKRTDILKLIMGVNLLGVIIVLLSLFLFTVIYYFYYFSEPSVKEEIYTYRYRQIDPVSNISSVGFITSFNNIGSEGSVSYLDENDKIILVSSFDTDEYECIGSCFCDAEGTMTERRASIPLVKGVSYLVAAITSVVAFDLAKKYFDNECQNRFGDKCPQSAIQSKIDECIPIIRKDFVAKKVKEGEYKTSTERMSYTYTCSGECRSYDYAEGFIDLVLDEHKEYFRKKIEDGKNREEHQQALDEYDCTQIKLTKKQVVNIDKEDFAVFEIDGEYVEKLAVADFVTGSLNPYCAENGKVRVGEKKVNIPVCAGYDNEHQNPSVKCVKTTERMMKKKWFFFWFPA